MSNWFGRKLTGFINDQFLFAFYSRIVSNDFFSELSTSVKTQQYDQTKSDIAKSGNRKLYFDTHAVVQLLEDSGQISLCLIFCVFSLLYDVLCVVIEKICIYRFVLQQFSLKQSMCLSSPKCCVSFFQLLQPSRQRSLSG